MELTFLSEYWDDADARAAFKHFILDIHRLDFTAWEEAGYWDERYTPFSYFEGERVVASMCVYLLDAVIDGNSRKLVQISGVGTVPEYRRRGLNRELTEIGLAWAAEHDPAGVFLFSDEGAIPFYRAGGFEPIQEYLEFVDLEESMPASELADQGETGMVDGPGLRRLDPTLVGDRDHIYAMAQRRTPLSQRFSVMNPKLVMFHCLYPLSQASFEIPDLDCVVLADRRGGVLRIYDILAEQIPSWSELSEALIHPGDRRVEFHFFTDQLGVPGVQRRALSGNHPFVRAGFPLAEPVFPFTARA